MTRWTVVEPPLLPVSEDGPLCRRLLQVDVNLVARVLEVAPIISAAACIQWSTPALGICDGNGILVEITTLLTPLERSTGSVLGLKKSVVGATLGPAGTLLDLEGDAQFPEHRSDELLLQLGFVPLGCRPLFVLVEVGDIVVRSF